MKKLILVALCLSLLTACSAKSIEIIGGADGPTAVYVGKK